MWYRLRETNPDMCSDRAKKHLVIESLNRDLRTFRLRHKREIASEWKAVNRDLSRVYDLRCRAAKSDRVLAQLKAAAKHNARTKRAPTTPKGKVFAPVSVSETELAEVL
jgi:hypothetical protein